MPHAAFLLCASSLPASAWPATRRENQSRTATPAEAASLGADYVVLGRSVTAADDPAAALARAIDELRAS